jgi:hypothetical protein
MVLTLAVAACDRPLEMVKGSTGDEVPRPEWRMGDRWVYQRTTPTGAISVVTYLVTGATADGYTVRLGGLKPEVRETWTRDLHLKDQRIEGRGTAEFVPPARFFSWPLRLAQTWSQSFRFQDGRQDGDYANIWQVGALVNQITVPAGTYYTIRIERRGSGGEALDMYWYSPKVRHWVKRESYGGGYVDELVEGPPGS